MHVTSVALLVELLPTPYHLQATIYQAAFQIACATIVPPLVAVIKTWRYVQLVVSAPGIVFLAHVW